MICPVSQALMTPPELPAAGAFAALPVGLRDLLPSACRRRRAITDALLDVFDRWGYAPVSTPGIEYFDIFGRGLHESERGACVRFIEARTGEVVTLRSDVTPQVARLAVDDDQEGVLGQSLPDRRCEVVARGAGREHLGRAVGKLDRDLRHRPRG